MKEQKYLLKKSCPSPDEFALKIEYDPQIVIAKPTRNSINVIKFSEVSAVTIKLKINKLENI